MGYITKIEDYWVAPSAINISLNALGDTNRIQGSVASGAVISCYIDGIPGLELDNGRNPKRWPLSLTPTYFNSFTEKYVYAAIPRTTEVGTMAVIVFPSEQIFIDGTNEAGDQVGSEDYYYVWLHGIISATDGNTPRTWTAVCDFGSLGTYEDIVSVKDVDWYSYDKLTQIVTFLKGIVMKPGSSFYNLILGGKELKGVATADTSAYYIDSDTLVATPGYLHANYLNKKSEDTAEEQIGFLKGLWIGVKGLYEITADGIAKFKSLFAESVNAQRVQADDMQSSNFTGDGIADTGWKITNAANGHSKLTIDEIYVRMKAVFESLEVRERTYTGGDQIWSCAGNLIVRTDYLGNTETADHVPVMIPVHADGSPSSAGSANTYMVPQPGDTYGYSEVKVSWLLRGVSMILGRNSGLVRGLYSRYKKVRIVISDQEVASSRGANRAAAVPDINKIRRARCYFLAKDGDREIHNWWRINDLARCQTMNLANVTRETYISGEDTKQGNVFWWRKVIGVSYAPVQLDDGKWYHYFDVSFDYDLESSSPETMATSVMEGSDIPAAGDSVVQFGNTIIEGRMNLMMMEVNGGDAVGYSASADAPCLKAYRGVYSFDLTKCWIGGNCCKMKLSPKSGYEFYGPHFKQVTEYDVVPVPVERGLWTNICRKKNSQGQYIDEWEFEEDDYGRTVTYSDDDTTGRTSGVRKCYYYDKVSHNGSYWLCSIVDGSHWVNGDGEYITDAQYDALSEEAKHECARKQNYTIEEPSENSIDWTKLVEKGTSIKTVVTKYAKQTTAQYTGTPPTTGWQDSIAALGTINDGDYLWAKTTTSYSDTLSDSTVYSVSRWGIDGDGIANIETKFYEDDDLLSQSDLEALSENSWKDTYSGLALNQGDYIYTRTKITYDSGDTPTVSYSVNRLGEDGVGYVTTEEYYCLGDSMTTPPAHHPYQGSNHEPDIISPSTMASRMNGGDWSEARPTYDTSTAAGRAKKYLWNFEAGYTTNANEVQITEPLCIGNYEKGIASFVETYTISTHSTKADMLADTTERTAHPWVDEVQDSAPTDDYPYQWNKTVTTYTDGSSDTFYHISAVKGTHGANSVRLALDNEHEDFIYSDSSADPISPATITSQARLYDGGVRQTSGITWYVSCDGGNTYEAASSSYTTGSVAKAKISSNGLVTVAGIFVESAVIKVGARYNGNNYHAELTINKTKQDKYDLKLVPDAIAFNSSDTWTDKTITPSAERTDIQGNKTTGLTIQTSAADGLRLYYSYVNANGSLVTPSLNLLTTSTFTLTETPANTYIGVYFELRLYSGNSYRMCDYETVEIVKTANGPTGPAGTSVIINGDATYFHHVDSVGNTRPLHPTIANLGEVDLLDYDSITGDMIDVCEEIGNNLYGWEAYSVPVGTCYLFNKKLYEATETGWLDLGQFRGDNGKDGWMITADPANVIITQGLGSNSSQFSIVKVGFTAKKGSAPATVSSIGTPTSTEFNVTKGTGDDAKKVVVSSPKTHGTPAEYYTEGTFLVTVNVTDPDTSSTVSFNVTVPCYANLLGTWKREVENGVETVVAHLTQYLEDEDGNIITSESLREDINDATRDISTLSNTVTTQGNSISNLNTRMSTAEGNISTVTKKVNSGKNLLTGVLTGSGWNRSGSTVKTNDEEKFTLSSGQYLESPDITIESSVDYYTISYDANAQATIGIYDYGIQQTVSGTNGTTEDGRYYFRFAPGSLSGEYQIRFSGVSYIKHPQLETGNAVTAFEADSSETSSRIHQTAEQIEELVNDTGVNIVNKTISLYADKVKFYKNKSAAQQGDPAKIWIDGGDGSLHAVDGHFEGTVRANNFYQQMSVFYEGDSLHYSQYSYCKYYCTDAYDTFQQGYYYDPSVVPVQWYYNFIPCTYDAEVVNLIPNPTEQWNSGKNTCYLPDPEDFVGKVVHVYAPKIGGITSCPIIDCVVRLIDQNDRRFAKWIYLDGNNRIKAQVLDPSDTVGLGTEAIYQAIYADGDGEYYWLKLL